MRKYRQISCFFIVILAISIIHISLNSSAALPVVKENDLVAIGYRLTISAVLVEVYTVQTPFKGQVALDIIRPIGLFNEVIGMKLGEVKNLIVAPEDGFSEFDSEYSAYAGLTLYYDDLTIFEINGVHITEVENGGITPGSFGFYFLRVVLGLLGGTAFVFLIYGGYKLYPRVFGKRCAVCKTLAVGTCRKCGKVFCERCYSNGCPYCKSRTMIRFKT